jgi:hypothetical protein
MDIAFLKHEATADIYAQRELTWQELGKLLAQARVASCGQACKGKDCPEKSGAAWIPAKFSAPRRLKTNVVTVSALVLDLDDVTAEELSRVLMHFAPFSYYLHSTHTNATSAGYRMRLVVQLEAPVPAAAWPRFVESVYVSVGRIGDEACRDPGRLYFLPTVPEGAEHEFLAREGIPYPTGVVSTPAPVSEEIVDSGMNVEWIRKSLLTQARTADPQHAGPMTAAATSRPLAESGGRDNALYSVAVGLSRAERPGGGPPPTPEEVEATLAFSIRTMDTAPEGEAFWMAAALKKYANALAVRRDRDDARDLAQAVVADHYAAGGFVNPDDLVPGNNGPAAVGRNAAIILERDSRWRGKVRWNEMALDLDLTGTPIAGREPVDTAFMNWIQENYDLRLKNHEVAQQLLLVARANQFNPVRTFLESLTWDGVDRASGFLFRYFGATTHLLGVHTAGFLSAISRRWLISAVARVFKPGCQVDTTLILEGEQGMGKSSALRILAGDEWYTGSKFTVGDKDARLVMSRKWIVEVQELASLRKADIETLRAFLTETHDTFRLTYGRKVETFPRRAIFVGTTNEFEEYLTDPAGNRRYWPVRCTEVDLEALKADREQLWAQATAMFKTGEQHWLTPAEEHLMQVEREGREAPTNTAEIAISEAIARNILLMPPDKRPKVIAADQAAVQFLGMEPSAVHPGVARKVDNAFVIMGAESARLYGVPSPGKGGRTKMHSRRKVWRIPQWLLEAPQGSRLEDIREEDRTTEREPG